MADEDLEKLFGDEAPPAEVKVEPKPQEPSAEEQAKQKLEEDLINLGKAKSEALAELGRIREEKRTIKQGKATEEELPKINLDDPSAKAWDRHIRESVQPVENELEKARQEVREYALQKFLKEKPALAKSPDQVKQLMNVYDRLHTASERTVEGVLSDLEMSYGAISYREREAADMQQRMEQAEADIQFSQAAISKGATGYQSTPSGKMPKLTDEEKDLIRKQGWSPEDWWKAKQEQQARV